jgi:hypothetical protein
VVIARDRLLCFWAPPKSNQQASQTAGAEAGGTPYYVGNMKGRSHSLVAFMDNPAKICFAKVYDGETRIIFADLLNGSGSPPLL